MRHLLIIGAVALALPRPAAAEELPAMDPDRPVLCYRDAAGHRWRMQCDEATRRCLYAPDGSFERTRECVHSEAGPPADHDLVRAIVDAPLGWTRDERGRVFQTSFDLRRRLYLGAAYAPSFGEGGSSDRITFDLGLLRYEVSGGRTRHRLRVIEGEVALAPLSGDLALVRYDLSHQYAEPILRLTTFVGKPRRHDIFLNLGAWLEGGRVEMRESDLGDQQLWRIATVHATVDLWRTADLYSYVRIRGGFGFEQGLIDTDTDRLAVAPGAALEGDIAIDRRGFHHLAALVAYDRPLFLEEHELLGHAARRFEARLSYEMIALAVNDQPLSIFLEGAAEHRDDLPGIPPRWGLVGKAGLRFSLWAPPRSPR